MDKHQVSNTTGDVVLDTRTPPRIKLHAKRKPPLLEDNEPFHAGIAVPLDENSVPAELLASTSYHLQKPTTSTDGALSTWVFLSGNSPHSTSNKPSASSRPPKPPSTSRPSTKSSSTMKIFTSTTAKPASTTTKKVTASVPKKKTTASQHNATTADRFIYPIFRRRVTLSTMKPKSDKTKSSHFVTKNGNVTTTVTTPSTTSIRTSNTTTMMTTVGNTTISTTEKIEKVEAKEGETELGKQTKGKKSPGKRKKHKNRRRKPSTSSNSTSKVDTKLKNNKQKEEENAVTAQFYNYLSREVMPTVGVGLVGLVVTAGLASYFLYPAAFTPLRRSYDVGGQNPHYRHPADLVGGVPEEEAIGKVIAGMEPSQEGAAASLMLRRQDISYPQRYHRNNVHDRRVVYGDEVHRPVYKEEERRPTYSDDIHERSKETGYTVSEQVTPAAVPEHGPRRRRRQVEKDNFIEHGDESTKKTVINDLPSANLAATTNSVKNYSIRGTFIKETTSTTASPKDVSTTTKTPDFYSLYGDSLADIADKLKVLLLKMNDTFFVVIKSELKKARDSFHYVFSKHFTDIQDTLNEYYKDVDNKNHTTNLHVN